MYFELQKLTLFYAVTEPGKAATQWLSLGLRPFGTQNQQVPTGYTTKDPIEHPRTS